MNSNFPRVSVLMATFNGAPWLREQIDSILNQQGVSVRIHIADDASTDKTLEVLSEISSNEDRLQLLDFINKAGSASANFFRLMMSADISDSDYVAFSDQDDVWLPEKLARAISFLKSGQFVGYSCATLAFWPDGREKLMSQNPRQREYDFLFEGAGQGCSFVLKRDLFLNFVGFLRENSSDLSSIHYHDWLLYAYVRSNDLGWYFDSTPMLRYRQHASNDTGARGSISGFYSRFEKIKNGWYTLQLQALLNLMIKMEGSKSKYLEVQGMLFRKRGGLRVFRSALWILENGRRRLLDRGVLAVSIIFGWI